MSEFRVMAWTRKASRLRPLRLHKIEINEVFVEAPDVPSALTEAFRLMHQQNPDPHFRAYVQIETIDGDQGIGDYALLKHLQEQDIERFIEKHCD